MLSNLKQHLYDFYFKSDSYTDQLICKLFGEFSYTVTRTFL